MTTLASPTTPSRRRAVVEQRHLDDQQLHDRLFNRWADKHLTDPEDFPSMSLEEQQAADNRPVVPTPDNYLDEALPPDYVVEPEK